MKTLSNDKITVRISSHGAELTSIRANGTEYLWQADPAFWGRHSPVLFPIVGRVWNNIYRNEGKEYELGQHGFARDMDFKLTHESDDSATYILESNEDTLKKYPFRFVLKIGYVLKGNRIEVNWEVKNTGEKDMYFQIGAHPAFYYRDLDTNTDKRGFLCFGNDHKKLEYISPAEKGCVSPQRHTLELADGWMELTSGTFDCDTYMFDNSQIQKITLADKNKRPYLSLEFSSPLVAIWSPSATRPDVPFVCIEPWYGRCDEVGYKGEFKNREWMQRLASGETFNANYSIILSDIG